MKMPLFQGAIRMPQIYLYAFCFFLLSPHSLMSQSNPCECGHRWQAGGKWVSGAIDDYADPGDVPLGIGRFVKDKETKIKPNGCTYEEANFPIVCSNPPNEDDPMVWINFDIREGENNFKMKIKNKNSDPIGWALYYSTVRQNGTNPPNDLSGNCNSLVLQTCGTAQNFQTISPQDPSQVTNYYLAVWSTSSAVLKKVKFFIKKAGPDCDAPPVAVCNEQVNVSLGPDGTATIPAEAFTEGAFDECSPVEDLEYRIRIPASGGGSVPADTDYTFDCDDVDELLAADIWVGDGRGNWSFCTTNILVEDKIDACLDCAAPPLVICSAQVNVSLGLDGTATVDAESFVEGAFDECTPSEDLLYRIRIPAGSGSTVPPDETYTFDCDDLGPPLISAEIWVGDDEGNWNACITDILVEDKINVCPDCGAPPVAVCFANVNVSIGADGTTTLSGADFDGGSFDECTPSEDLQYRIRIPIGSSSGVPPDETYTFDCDDVGNTLSAEIWVGDEGGNWNFCFTDIFVEDKFVPLLFCPSNTSVDCDADISDLTITGNASAEDNCVIDDLSYTDMIDDFGCGLGFVTRTWTATSNGQSTSCVQNITILPPPALTSADIVWPSNFSSNDCSLAPSDLNPDLLSPPFDQPVVNASECTVFGVNYEDVLLTISDCDGTFKILRTWSVIDWCTGRVFDYVQILEVTNDGFSLSDIVWPQDFSSIDCSLTPGDLTPENLSPPFDQPQLTLDACDVIGINYEDQLLSINDCRGTFKILRTWTVINWCTQDVFIHTQVLSVNDDAFSLADITWPADFNTEDCTLAPFDLIPSALSPPYNQPLLSVGTCDQIAFSYTDLVLDICDGSYKILRTWEVINWCTQDLFSHIQILDVDDFGAPNITSNCDPVSFCCNLPNCSDGFASLFITATDDCSAPSTLDYTYEIDLDADGTIELAGNGDTVADTFPSGQHQIRWLVIDDCGNSSSCTQDFSIDNCGESLLREAPVSSAEESAGFRLYQNYPNPWMQETAIEFDISHPEGALLEIYDLNGRTIKVFNQFNAGFNQVLVDRATFPSDGVYYYRLASKTRNLTKRMIVLK